MTTFMFWNIAGKLLQDAISSLVSDHNVDIVILAENKIPPSTLLSLLNQTGNQFYYAPDFGCDRIHIFARVQQYYFEPLFDSDHYTIRRLRFSSADEIIVAAAHLPSMRFLSDSDQAMSAAIFGEHIRTYEAKLGHSRALVVGDLNMNPFDQGMLGANSLNAVMSRKIALQKYRTIAGRNYAYFYNPMWNLFGDIDDRPPASYFYRKSSYQSLFWNMFDQVLLRPDLIERFDQKSLSILNSAGKIPLLTRNGLPDNTNFSDHLPIKFTLYP